MNKKKKSVNKKHRKNIDRMRKIRIKSNPAEKKAKKIVATPEITKKAAVKSEPKKTAAKKPAAKKAPVKKAAPKKTTAKKAAPKKTK